MSFVVDQDSLDTVPGQATACAEEHARASETAPAPASPRPRPRPKKPRPTFDDGALTRCFKFPSKTYPRSSYYVTGDEIIIRIRKFRKKWKLVIPKKRVVSYRTNRWFAKPRWVEVELTFTQATRLGLVGPSKPVESGSAAQTSEPDAGRSEEAPFLVQETETDKGASTDTVEGAEATLQLDTDDSDVPCPDGDSVEADASPAEEALQPAEPAAARAGDAVRQPEPEPDVALDSPADSPEPSEMATETDLTAAGFIPPPGMHDAPVPEDPHADSAAGGISFEQPEPIDPAIEGSAHDVVELTTQPLTETAPDASPVTRAAADPEELPPVSTRSDDEAPRTSTSTSFGATSTPERSPSDLAAGAAPSEIVDAPAAAIVPSPAGNEPTRAARRWPAVLLAACVTTMAAGAMYHSAPQTAAPVASAFDEEPELQHPIATNAANDSGTSGIVTGALPAPAALPDAGNTPRDVATSPGTAEVPGTELSPPPEPEAPREAMESAAIDSGLESSETPSPPLTAPVAGLEQAVAPPAPPAPVDSTAEECRQLLQAAREVRIEFDYASARIEPGPQASLAEVASMLRGCSGATAIVEGHADSDGDPERNQMVSVRRAQAVHDLLVSAGTAPRRLSVIGFGNTRPLVPNDSADNKRRNRRVTLVIDAPR